MWDDWCTSDVEFRAKANWSRSADDDVAATVVVEEEEEQEEEEEEGKEDLEGMPNGSDVAGEEDLLLAGGGGSRRSLSRSCWWAWAWAWTWARLSRSIFPGQSPGGAFII